VSHDLLQEKRELILTTADKHGMKNVRVFGSVSRREDGPESDLDLLVEFEKDRSLFDLIRFKQEMEDLLEMKVDVSTENSIHWSIKEDVLNEAVQL
jgi:hypothetical protein